MPMQSLKWLRLYNIIAERYKARVYGRSLAGIAFSNPAGGMDVCLSWAFCVVR